MPRAAEQKLYNTFIRGLITEVTKLNHPEDAASDALNFDFNRDGSVSRRLGVDREGGYASTNATGFTVSTDSVRTFEWTSVNGDATVDFVVCQFGQYLHFYDNGVAPSSSKRLFTVDLSTHQVSGATTAQLEQNEVDLSAGNGRLYVVHPHCEPFFVSFNTDTSVITGASNTNPCVVTSVAHPWEDGDEIWIEDVGGMTELNGNMYTVANSTANTFELSGINATGYGTYTTGGTVSANIVETEILIKVRDFEGVDDGLDVDEQPSTLTDGHNYNLNNQGWEARGTELGQVFSGRGTYPSNSETWQQGKYVHPTNGYEVFNYTMFEKQSYGNAAAPKGHYIYEAFNKSVAVTTNDTRTATGYSYANPYLTITFSAVHPFVASDTIYLDTAMTFGYDSGGGCPGSLLNLAASYAVFDAPTTTTIRVNVGALGGYVAPCSSDHVFGDVYVISSSTETDPIDQRPSVNTFFAGRAWYAGVAKSPYSGRIYFSQILDGDANAGNCYQAGDPTAEFENELVATDGGVIQIPEMNTVLRMEVVGASLIILCKNGIWQINGGESGFFTATSFSVRKITSAGLLAPKSYVEVEGVPYYWGSEGIFKLEQDEISGFIKSTNISVDTIQSYYEDIPRDYRAEAIGKYNDITKKVFWLFAPDSGYKDNVLVLDTVTSAFYPYEFDDSEQIIDMFIATDYTTPERRVKFVTSIVASGLITFSDLHDTNYRDWEIHSGVDAAAYLETNHENLNAPSKKTKQITYVTMFMTRTEDNWILSGSDVLLDNQSSCLLRAKWDWSDTNSGGRWSEQRDAYRFTRNYVAPAAPYPKPFDNGYPLTVTKNKIRGKGRSVRLRIDTTALKHCTIEGWSIDYTAGVAT